MESEEGRENKREGGNESGVEVLVYNRQKD